MSIYDELAGAAAVTMTEGAVKKITRKADSVVIWEKAPAFVWKKYNTVETVVYVEKENPTDVDLGFIATQEIWLYAGKTFNSADGSFSLSSPITVKGSTVFDKYTTHPYYSNGTYSCYKLMSTNGKVSMPSFDVYYMIGRELYREAATDYSQGTYIEDVTSDNESAYPDNGRHTDGYWYVKQ